MSGPRDWYKDAVIYEVHVRSYADSDEDGSGDLRGLISKLDHIQDLGVTALWLLPFFPSPLRDDGYDIADYEGVNPAYGTVADVRRLVREAHARGLRVIAELVCNHTSDQHPWFQRARQAPKGSRARNWYVWSDTDDRYSGVRIIFKDFERSNWTWDEVAQQYYWHRFYSHQPDLNYDEPAVRDAIKRVCDHWLDMGIDGLRLDAVPYLYEREGTSCENLPETHAFLKELRAHVDARYGDRMLLAEANQWPEDAAAYLGEGDECHMAFHFPLMPRLFMGIRMEDRFPIVDILAQTPAIPPSAQWALFLRNHDELTLEMVTDEERDQMYRVYAKDATARINLGIRRRLAPLLGNDRRRMELMTALLLSLPGTPVIYYGDEIGMGDNIYLGDRNGVRTPMQWSGDRNAGFSRANRQRLFLPVIVDPEYHYESLNVEAQRANPHSLLSWTKRLIALRKRHAAFGRGTFELLQPENRKVLAYLRRHGDETILCVANLSRFAQPCELDLRAFAGWVPVELFGQTEFPRIGDLPYFVTLGPHAFNWFRLEERPALPVRRPRVVATIEADVPWPDVLGSRRGREAVAAALLPYVIERRWFLGKARRVNSLRIADVVVARDAEDAVVTLVEAAYTEGEPETYVVPLRLERGEVDDRDAVARLTGAETGTLVDAMGFEAFDRALVRTISRRRRHRGDGGSLVGVAAPALPRLHPEAAPLPDAALSRAEQSNTTVIFGDRLILKLYRKFEPGAHPDVEVGRFLTERARFPHTAEVAGSIEYEGPSGESTTLALLQAYVPNQGDAWSRMLRELEALLDRAGAGPPPAIPALPLLALSSADAPGPEGEALAPLLAFASRLGTRTAELHLALASDRRDPAFAPQPFDRQWQRSLYQSVRTQVSRALRRLGDEARRQEGALLEEARAVIEREAELLDRPRALTERPLDAWRTRVHGDYHLGQVLIAGEEPVIIDFEGEPAIPLSERRAKRSPLHDVAGMLRSFDYAAHVALDARRDPTERERGWVAAWAALASAAYLRAYREAAAGSVLWPSQPQDAALLLDVHLIDKAARELQYELASRPAWARVPLRGLRAILDAPRQG